METMDTKIEENQPQTAVNPYLEVSDDKDADNRSDGSGDQSPAFKEETDITKDITRRLSTLQLAKSVCKLDGCRIPPSEFIITLRVHPITSISDLPVYS